MVVCRIRKRTDSSLFQFTTLLGGGHPPYRGLVRRGGDLGQYSFGVSFGELLRLDRVVHGAELGTAHRAEGCVLETLLRQGLVVVGAGGLGVERELELLVPIESEAGA